MIIRGRCDDCASRHFMPKASAIGAKCLPEVSEIDVEIFRIELDPHQEQTGLFVGVFVGVQDVAVVAVDEVGNRRDFAFASGQADQEDGRILHVACAERSSCPHGPHVE